MTVINVHAQDRIVYMRILLSEIPKAIIYIRNLLGFY